MLDSQFFRGFIRLSPGEKKPLDKFKGAAVLWNVEQANTLPDVAGVIAADSVLIDVDDADTAARLFELVKAEHVRCRVVKTTRGKHFFFRNTQQAHVKCATGITLALGLRADIKCGLKPCYAVAKQGGVDREVEYDVTPYDDVPQYLRAVPNMPVLAGMPEGGRNTAMFKATTVLQRAGFTHESAREILALANAHLLAEPLDDAELDTATREALPVEESLRMSFWVGDKFQKAAMVDYLLDRLHVVRIDGRLHTFDGRVYTADAEAAMQHEMLRVDPTLKRCHRSEVIDHIDCWVKEETPRAGAEWIAFSNGVYNVRDDVLVPFSPDIVATNLVPHAYNDAARDATLDDAMRALTCGDEQIEALMYELCGYCLYRRNALGKFFILTGSGSNGKSTFLKMLRTMLGSDNCCSLDLAALDGDKFAAVGLHGKLANIGDDIGDDYISSTATLKKIVTGEQITAQQKFEKAFSFAPTCKLIFSANAVPRLGRGRDNSALMRRLVIVPFNAKFTPGAADYKMHIDDDLSREACIEYLIARSIAALRHTLAVKGFTQSDAVDAELKEFEETNNPLVGFINDVGEAGIVGHYSEDTYAQYEEFCEANGLRPHSRIEFSRQICRMLGLCTRQIMIGGRRYRQFERQPLN